MKTIAHGACAEEAGRVDKGGLDGGEAGDERLHGEGQAVDDGADDEAGEGEGERMAEEGGDAAADGGARTEQNEKKEAEDGGRQDERQSGESLKSGEPAAAAEDQQRRKRDGDGQQNRGGDGCELESEGERLPVHGSYGDTARFLHPLFASRKWRGWARVLVNGCEAAFGKLGLDRRARAGSRGACERRRAGLCC